jgi:MFS family permease
MMVATTRHHTRLPLYALLTANAVSLVGNSLSYIAVPWFVLATTGSAAKTGLVAAASMVAVALTGIFGGALVDRVGYKRMAVVSDIASGVNVALIPLCYQTIGLPFWLLLVFVFLGAVLDTPGFTARFSLFPDLATRAEMPLERANAIAAITRRSAVLVGAPLAGLLIVILGTTNLFWIDAASFAVSALVIAAAIPGRAPTPKPASTHEAAAASSYVGELLEGLRFIRGDRLIVWSVATFALGGLLAEPVYSVIMPVYAREVYGSALDLGFMYAALAAGSIVGAAFYAVYGHRLPRRATLLTAFTVRALTFWVLVAMPPLGVVVAAIVLNAAVFEPCNPMAQTILQERVPDGMRGRVFGTIDSIATAAYPIGMVAWGFAIAELGLQTSLYVFATVNLALPLIIAAVPVFRQMEVRGRVTESQSHERALAAVPDV